MEPDDDKTRSYVALTKGTMVSHYRIIEKIGAGGMGEVYLAKDTELNRKVALKFLPPYLCQDEECRKRFTREAQAAASLDHPNIAAIYEVGEYNGRPFFSMQVVEGQSLRDVVTGKDLPIDRILEIAIQICEGLQAAHDKGIIHRDIKPSNILIDDHGRVRIVDFGLASVVGTDQLTKTGSTLGTIGYMSPEQVQGKEVDHRNDLFSLGVVLYELITKQNPFKRDSEAATLKAVSDDTPEPLARFKSGLPDGLQAIIDKALEKDVKTRYQHADGILSDLMRLKRSLDVSQSTGAVPMSVRKSRTAWWIATAIVVVAVIAVIIVVKPWTTGDVSKEPDKIMLAVLPFENLGNPEDEYFADGITEEILTNLAKLSGLGVISRTSAMQYKNSEKGLRQIGEELGVDYVLEGTIRWDKSGDVNRVRIHPQLIKVADDTHLWADRYDAILSDVFEIQSGIAEKVAEALNVALLETERRALAQQPTENTEAYDYYLRGKQYFSVEAGRGDYRSAEAMHRKAIELEPEFALAYAELGMVYTDMYWHFFDRTEQRLTAAKETIDKALELAPDEPVAHLALGWYYYHGHLDYEQALIASIAYAKRRQGEWDKAIEYLKRAIKLNPREPHFLLELGMTLMKSHQYEEAEYYCDRAIELAPDIEWPYLIKSWSHLARLGDTKKARDVLQVTLERNGRSPILTFFEMLYDCYDEQFERALSLITAPGQVYYVPRSDTAEYYLLKGPRSDTAEYYLLKGEIYRYMNRPDLMKPYYDSARVVLEEKIADDPDDPLYHSIMGRVYAGLARKGDAIREGLYAVELLPLSKDAVIGAELVRRLAQTYTAVGEYNLAIDQLEYLLAGPSNVSVSILKKFPDYKPLRNHPRFQALLKRYENNQ
jgi:serine/threonine protein kinase/Tfp pilus assembly protein PilF